MLNDVGSVLAGLVSVAIILMGLRYLLDTGPAAGFGIPGATAVPDRAWLAVKAARAIGIAFAVLLIDGAHGQLG